MDRHYDAGALGFKKKRGRPRKKDTILLPGEVSALGVTPSSDAKTRKPKLTNSEVPQSVDPNRSLLGQPVSGVVDGSFDAGYLVTVRVGDSDTVFRGVVFGPGLSIPLSKANDIAPKVKTAPRDAGTAVSSSPASLSPKVAAPSPADYDRHMPAITPQNASAGAALGTPPSSAQETRAFALQHDFLQNAAQGFTPQGYSTSIQGFHLAVPPFAPPNSHFGTGAQGGPNSHFDTGAQGAIDLGVVGNRSLWCASIWMKNANKV